MPPSSVHFNGSVNLPDAETVMREIATRIPHGLRRMTDGETGERNYWIHFQVRRTIALRGSGLNLFAQSDHGLHRCLKTVDVWAMEAGSDGAPACSPSKACASQPAKLRGRRTRRDPDGQLSANAGDACQAPILGPRVAL
jgi:hypothetical protein